MRDKMCVFKGHIVLLAAGHQCGFDVASNLSGGTVSSLDFDIKVLLELGNVDISRFETNDSWEVVIENGDSCNGVVTCKPLFGFSVVKFNSEFKIWLDIWVVDNFDRDFHGFVSFFECVLLIVSFEVGARYSGISDSSYAKFDFSINLLFQGDPDFATALKNRVVKA